jgi:hypothetical protein
MDVCFSPNLELKLILETCVVISSFEEDVPDVSRGLEIAVVDELLRLLFNPLKTKRICFI